MATAASVEFGHDSTPEYTRVVPPRTVIVQGEASIAGTTVEFTSESPYTITKTTPRVLIVPGLLSEEGHYDNLRKETAQLGAVVTTFQQPGQQALHKGLHPVHLSDVLRVQSQVPWAVMKATHKILGGETDEPIQSFLAGHSMGGYNGARLAAAKPAHVEGLILLGAAGMRKHTLAEMIGRTIQFGSREVAPVLAEELAKNPLAVMRSGVGYAGRVVVNLPRRVREVAAVVVCDAEPALISAGQQGVDIHVGAFEDDSYSTMAENIFTADRLGIPLTVQAGDHLAPQKQPDAVAAFIMSSIRMMREDRQQSKPRLSLVS